MYFEKRLDRGQSSHRVRNSGMYDDVGMLAGLCKMNIELGIPEEQIISLCRLLFFGKMYIGTYIGKHILVRFDINTYSLTYIPITYLLSLAPNKCGHGKSKDFERSLQ